MCVLLLRPTKGLVRHELAAGRDSRGRNEGLMVLSASTEASLITVSQAQETKRQAQGRTSLSMTAIINSLPHVPWQNQGLLCDF